MVHFLVEYRDLGNAAARDALRGEHIAYRKRLGADMALAGPLLDAEERPIGSVVIVQADDEAGAGEIASADPYVAAGVFELVSVRRYRIAAMHKPA
ncbi:YciI family protein [Sphingomonas hengshuiensis]|uniref:YCII-related domain-containing protein n=1 Tax=Sphingomonas hengshuiensis TaxID=1609977 RepID=A0A7U4LFI9_9SPHN|nr:YciI family protein [Sphingomonas hengshuiensis]AJP72537.1 hypothetical protein TS85_13265 [Sphingomonas hengshuiensis]